MSTSWLNNLVTYLDAGFDVFLKLQKLEELVLQNTNCNNKILPFLTALKSLTTLDLSGNYLEGSLPEFSQAFTKLSNLEVLNLEYNGLNSFLQFHDWKNTSKLKVLYLGQNNFSRGIPPSILTLNSLQALSLYRSNLNGTISPGLCDLKNLRDLDLSVNKFEGFIPPCVNNLTSLRMIDFSDNQLYIPSSLISNLKSLEFISLNGNQFVGGLHFTSPPLLSNQLKVLQMPNCNLNISTIDLLKFLHNQHDLRFLDLSHNNLHGNFPNWLVENNTRLELFYLRNNSLTGHIQLGVVDSVLSNFDVSNNLIQGKLQTDIGEVLSKLYLLNVSKNSIEGTLPISVGNMKNLLILDFSTNKLFGEIPESWGLSNLNNLKIVILSNNRLNGRISPNLFNITSMHTLRLNNNQFTGNIPSHIVEPSNLSILDLSQNHMSGTIPSWIGKSNLLLTLVLRNNSFYGPIPLEICNSSKVEFLGLSHNQLSGSIPSCLNLTSLKYMHLQGNNFSGSIPKAIVHSSNLITLDLRHNNLSGNIPRWFGYLRNLRVLLLKGNHLKGSISRQLCQLTRIRILDISNNIISGSIPPCISNITFGKNGYVERAFDIERYGDSGFNNLKIEDALYSKDMISVSDFYFIYSEQEEVEFMTKSRSDSYKGDILNFMAGMDFSCNNFTGDIPPELGVLTAIRALNLSHNQLTGSIPNSLSNLNQLESMDLSHNRLTGEIPSKLIDISTLEVFTVAYNNLTGRIPDKAQFSTFGETSYEGNLFLCGPPLQHQCKTIRVPVTTTIISKSEKHDIDPITFIASFVATYIVCLLGFVAVLCINPYWRRMWFNFIDACLSFMFPFWSEAIYK
ncbi:Receptor-kinase protein [Thalictrum thalictroides]|uniref:Receptor-kinase protein n=1 Tax=Thalictrum thalictroides TaxID=46969 RepID=A0A7J6X232_THATH|nr:Receptor-kinase protein [Thalictrum thalictroides]